MSDEHEILEWPEYEEGPTRAVRIRAQRQGEYRDPASAGSDLTRAPRLKTLYMARLKEAVRAIRKAKGFGRKRLAHDLADATMAQLTQDTGGDNYAD